MLVSRLMIGAAVCAAALTMTGCNRDPVTTVPGHLEPGSTLSVANQVLGSGGPGGGDDRTTIGTTPYIPWSAPNLPLMVDGEVDVLVFAPKESRNGLALRDRHYVYVKVREQSFAPSWRHHYKQPLIQDDVLGTRPAALPGSTRLRPQVGAAGVPGEDAAPYVRSNQQQTSVTIAEVNPDGSSMRVIGRGSVPSSSLERDLEAQSANYLQGLMQNLQGAEARGSGVQPVPAPTELGGGR